MNNGRIYKYGFYLSLFIAFALMIKGWNGSLIEQHGFRQTQTAISSYYMLKGGNLICYQTPVLGPPWTIPMEFPFYQIVVSLFVALTGYALDQSGRVVSILFFMSALYPIYQLSKPYFADKSRAFILLIFLCMSPQYVYWSRTFMIESTAFSLSIWYLYFIGKYIHSIDNKVSRRVCLICILTIGVLSSVTKVTTFFIYFMIGILFIAKMFIESECHEDVTGKIKQHIPLILVSFVAPVAAIVFWTHYSDHMKSLSALGSGLTSAGLSKWNFGSLSQKLDPITWSTIINRSITNSIGSMWLILPTFMILPFCRKATIVKFIICSVLFAIPVIVFTNLYYVHNYYVYANGIFIILAIAFIVDDVSQKGKAGYFASLFLILVISVLCIDNYIRNYLPVQGSKVRYGAIKSDIDKYSTENDVIIIYGADWSSEMPYYLERKAMMLSSIKLDDPKYTIAKASLSGYPIGAVGICSKGSDGNNITMRLIRDFLGETPVVKKEYSRCDFYFRETKSGQ